MKINQDRWNNVKNDYTEPLTHDELEEVRNNPISVALTVGKKVPKEWFEKTNGKKILGLACGGGQQGPVFAVKGYDVTIMDFSKSQLQKDAMVAKREGLKINTVQGDMTKPFQIRGQLKNGLAMIDFYESCDNRHRLSRYGSDYIATLCIKL